MVTSMSQHPNDATLLLECRRYCVYAALLTYGNQRLEQLGLPEQQQ